MSDLMGLCLISLIVFVVIGAIYVKSLSDKASIKSGIIVSKNYIDPHDSEEMMMIGEVPISQTAHHSPRWTITFRQKDPKRRGCSIERTVDVAEAIYSKYKVGDFIEFSN